ncbi:MAG: hypothetical protein VKL42_04425 [Snowella sp.]|nr:hypothetical protein [Snowella sp.]
MALRSPCGQWIDGKKVVSLQLHRSPGSVCYFGETIDTLNPDWIQIVATVSGGDRP